MVPTTQMLTCGYFIDDLRAGAYITERLVNDSNPLLFDVNPMKGPTHFSSSNVRKLGRR